MNTIPSFNKYTRRLQAAGYAMRYPSILRRLLQNSVSFLYGEGISKKCQLASKLLNEIIDMNERIALQNFGVREGNVSHFELMAIAVIIANKKPKRLLEIGTFDGNTTLQMALNTVHDAVIQTLDLPNGEVDTAKPILDEDMKYVQDQAKLTRKFQGTSVAGKVIQHLGDSTSYDFAKFTTSGPIDFCFIDGGHSYECVKSDTENVLKIMAPHGVIMWHDFTPNCPGVYRYLSELAKTEPLIHLHNTHLVIRM